MTDCPEPRAKKACDDLIAFLALAKDMPDAAQAFSDCIKFGHSVIVCHVDRDAAVITGRPVVRFQLNETLLRYLIASRAMQVINTGTPAVV